MGMECPKLLLTGATIHLFLREKSMLPPALLSCTLFPKYGVSISTRRRTVISLFFLSRERLSSFCHIFIFKDIGVCVFQMNEN